MDGLCTTGFTLYLLTIGFGPAKRRQSLLEINLCASWFRLSYHDVFIVISTPRRERREGG